MTNLFDKVNLIAQRPPAICHIKIPGMRGATVGVMSAIIIQNVGQINYMSEYNANIPDVYQISITIQELITESRQILAGSLEDAGKVFADVSSAIEDTVDEAKNTFNQVVDTVKGATGN